MNKNKFMKVITEELQDEDKTLAFADACIVAYFNWNNLLDDLDDNDILFLGDRDVL